eukprot:3941245-Rhodomonas_salina.2
MAIGGCYAEREVRERENDVRPGSSIHAAHGVAAYNSSVPHIAKHARRPIPLGQYRTSHRHTLGQYRSCRCTEHARHRQVPAYARSVPGSA